MIRGLFLAVVMAASLVSCGGGGGDDGGGSIGTVTPIFNMTGQWSGSYQLPSGTVTLVGTITAAANSYNGTFTTSNGATLTVSGQVSGATATLAISSTMQPACNGNFSGAASLSQPGGVDRLTFSFSGSDCNGAVAGIPGTINRVAGAPLVAPLAAIAYEVIDDAENGASVTPFGVAEISFARGTEHEECSISLVNLAGGAAAGTIDPKSLIVTSRTEKAIVLIDAGDPTKKWIIVGL